MNLSFIKNYSRKRKFVILGTVALILSTTIAVTFSQRSQDTRSKASAPANAIQATGTYTDWNWPSQNYTNFQWQVTPNNEQVGPDAYFYSHQFGLVNGQGGYAGIQGDRNGKRAIFSIWDTLAAEGPEIARPFGGEGIGYQTIINYPWVVGRTYAFKVERMEQNPDGTWWGGWVTDQTTGTKSFIGKIKAPPAWGALSGSSIVWTERYSGSNTSCNDIHYSSVNFTSFTANNGSITPSSHNNHLAQPEGCPGSLISDIAVGVRQEMGIGNPVPPIIQVEAGNTYLSDLVWTYAANGYGEIQKDKSASGGIITLNSQRYAKGLGTHANAEIRYNLSGRYTSFKTDVGIDEYQISVGSVIFQVWADGAKLFDSGTVTADSQTKSVDVDVTGKQELKLIVTDAGDGINYDHSDWANARLVIMPSIQPTATPTPSPVPTSTPTPTQTPTPTLPLPTPTNTPTPSSIPTASPTRTPTPIPTSTPAPTSPPSTPTSTPAPSSTSLSLNLFLHGIGRGGDSANPGSLGNANPLRTQRTVRVELYSSQNQLALTKEGTVSFNSTNGNFKGNIDLGGTIPTGAYTVKIKTDQFLKRIVPGIQIVTREQTNILPQTTLTSGDINSDNKINILDYAILLDCYSDIGPARNCMDPLKKLSADITDDGNVNQFDYNLFIRELTNIIGE